MILARAWAEEVAGELTEVIEGVEEGEPGLASEHWPPVLEVAPGGANAHAWGVDDHTNGQDQNLAQAAKPSPDGEMSALDSGKSAAAVELVDANRRPGGLTIFQGNAVFKVAN